jgi:hypothetical protein
MLGFVLFCFVLFCFVLFCFVLFCFVLFCLTTCSCIECKLAHLFFSFHCACYCRVRSASVEVIEALVSAGADPDSRNMLSASVSPLTLVLLRGAASTATGARLIGAGAGTGEDMGGLGLSPPGHNNNNISSRLTVDGKHLEMDNMSVGSAAAATGGAGGAGGAQSALDPERTRVAGRRVWIRAAEALMKCGTYYIPLLLCICVYVNPMSFALVLQVLTGTPTGRPTRAAHSCTCCWLRSRRPRRTALCIVSC